MSKTILKLLLFVLPTLVSVYTVDQFEFPKSLVLVTVAIGLLAYGWINVSFYVPVNVLQAQWMLIKQDYIGWTMLAFLGSQALSTVTSISPHVSLFGSTPSLNGLVTGAAYVVLYYAAVLSFRTSSKARSTLRWILPAMALACMYFFMQVAGLDPLRWHQQIDFAQTWRTGSTLGHPNFLAAWLVIGLPFAWMELATAIQEKRKLDSACLFILLWASLVVVGICQSRGSWQALLAVAAISSLIVGKWSKKLVGWTLATLASLWIWCAGLLYVLHNTRHTVVKSMLERFVGLVHLDVPRTEYWKTAWKIFMRYPVLGSGTDTFQLAFEHMRSPTYWMAEWAGAPHRAHNEVLNILATQGAVGFITMWWLLCAIGYTAWKVWRQPTKRAELACVSGMIVAFLVTGFSSFTVVSTGSLFVVALAWLSVLSRTGTPVFYKWVNVDYNRLVSIRSAVTAMVLVTALFWSWPLVWQRLFADIQAHHAMEIAQLSPQLAVIEADQAAQKAPQNDNYMFLTANLAENVANHTKDVSQKAYYRGVALRAYQSAIAMAPQEAAHSYLFGRNLLLAIREKSVDEKLAPQGFDALSTALTLEPANALYLAGTAELMLVSGRSAAALEVTKSARKLYPDVKLFHEIAAAAAYAEGDWAEASREFAKSETGKEFYVSNARPEMLFSLKRTEFLESLGHASSAILKPDMSH